MTDYDKFKKIIDEFEIECETNVDTNSISVLMNTCTNKVSGYVGFCASFKFDKDGKFKEMEIWEE